MVFKIISGNNLIYQPTNQQADRPTLAKQYTPSSSKGGIEIGQNLSAFKPIGEANFKVIFK